MASPAVPPPITTTLWFLAALVTGGCVAAVAKDRIVRAAVAVRAARLQNIIFAWEGGGWGGVVVGEKSGC